jgi:hypothetical protein
MDDKVEICRELSEILLELGHYGRRVKVSFDERLQVWRVNYDKEGRSAMVFMEEEEVERCLSVKKSLRRGLRAPRPLEGEWFGVFR